MKRASGDDVIIGDRGADRAEDRGVLRFMTCGSVDDGKSTLIGRLLFDSKALLGDTLATLERHAVRRGLSAPDLSLLTDGLVAEREQGITIDVAYRYFATPRRSFIIADAPGHEQYTRNMVTAASTADAAILLIDARKGVLPQTKRHATLARLLRVQRLIVAVNKMDLVDFDPAVFERIVADFRGWLNQDDVSQDERGAHGEMSAAHVDFIPISALDGDMVVERRLVDDGARLNWYAGPTLVELLEDAPSQQWQHDAALRLPVQWVCRPERSDFRGYAGRIESGRLRVGDTVAVWPSGARAQVTRIGLGEIDLDEAGAGQSVMVSLDAERDITRGDMLVAADAAADIAAAGTQNLSAVVCWLAAEPLSTKRSYLLAHTTRAVKARVTTVPARLDIHALRWIDGDADGGVDATAPIAMNDIAQLAIKTQQPLLADPFAVNRFTGSFILIDEANNNTVAAGVIR